MSLTILVFYLIIKQTDKKLFWTLIPISAFVYNPLTTSAYWSLAILGWIFQMLGITATIYFLNKKSINLKMFGGGIFTAIFSTFSILIGVVSWFSGLLMLLQDSSKKKFSNKKCIFYFYKIFRLKRYKDDVISTPNHLELARTCFSILVIFLSINIYRARSSFTIQ